MSRRYTTAWWCSMAVCCVAAAVAICMQPAQADEWTGKDKAAHAQAGALIGGIAAAASQSPTVGCLMAAAAGISKEVWDAHHPGHDPSAKDAIVTTAAGCLSAKVVGVVIGPRFIGFKKEF
ncbi:MAG TPA: hypothetical protein VFM33_13985 [Aquabacterium sp.]|nr:hypothetical protein [Aquabacterium sp.]